jgi:predicted MPP superfamily phosphohydrolase
MTRLIAFKLLFTAITVALLLFEIVIWKKLSPRFKKSKRFKAYRILYFSMVAVSQSVLWFAILYPGRGLTTPFPEWYIPVHKILLAINYSHFFWLLPISVLWLLGMILKRVFRLVRAKPTPESIHHSSDKEGVSRADFLRKTGGAASVALNLIPAATSAAAISGMFLGSREIWVNEKPIRIRNLHDDLKGLKLVQISDIHIGNLIHEKYLNFTLGLIRQAKPDYVLVTGDIIDNNNVFLPVAGNFFALLRAMLPWGHVLGVMGNHDYIDNGDKAAQSFGDAGMNILRNELFDIKRGRGGLQVVGLDYPPMGQGRGEMMQKYFRGVQKNLRANLPVIVLNHHPSDFDFLKTQKVDLVLSGHTHGGQINFSQNRESLLNGGRWAYKYYVDHYEENGSQLYVNRGLGHWFPLRISCPPEITVFTIS